MDTKRDPLHHKGAVVSYTIATILITFVCVLHSIATYKTGKSLHRKYKNKTFHQKRKTLLPHYLTAIFCGLSILSYLVISVAALMAESHFPTCFCDKLQIIIPNLYALGKTINYYFFIVRAKASQGVLNIFPTKLCGIKFPSKDTMFNIVFPIMLFNTFLIYIVLGNIGPPFFELWTGICVYKPAKLGCQYIMSDDFILLSNLMPITDILLCVLFSYIFYAPILKVSEISLKDIVGKRQDDDMNTYDTKPSKAPFIRVLKISLVLSLINVFSTTICFLILPYFAEFWWLWSVDYVVNSMCCFLMMSNDRKLLAKICVCFSTKHNINGQSRTDNVGSETSPGSESEMNSSADTMRAMQRIEMQKKHQNLMINSQVEDTGFDGQ